MSVFNSISKLFASTYQTGQKLGIKTRMKIDIADIEKEIVKIKKKINDKKYKEDRSIKDEEIKGFNSALDSLLKTAQKKKEEFKNIEVFS